jgi:hypothetical protein
VKGRMCARHDAQADTPKVADVLLVVCKRVGCSMGKLRGEGDM